MLRMALVLVHVYYDNREGNSNAMYRVYGKASKKALLPGMYM